MEMYLHEKGRALPADLCTNCAKHTSEVPAPSVPEASPAWAAVPTLIAMYVLTAAFPSAWPMDTSLKGSALFETLGDF